MALFLKNIELFGFKSFPLKTNIELVDGITGIVGANGSGKSNIVESIKWVLGEQSAKSLRGEKMEDVIFNGTKNRAPMGVAEVSLTFNNESHWLNLDYNEVSITRRMFRTGESQYFINKSKVRLKDIVELFLDTGIGRDSYAIFEQGKIDRLLSESPLERRIIFEEFAGISKYKFRKEEAEKKLENSRQNLDRVNDFIIELEKEEISLREQKENTIKYNELNKLLREKEIQFELKKIKNIDEEIHKNNINKNKAQEKYEAILKEKVQNEEKLITIDNEIKSIENEYNKYKEDKIILESKIKELTSRININNERKTMLQNQLTSMESRLKEGTERYNILKKELSDSNLLLEDISQKKDDINEEINEIKISIENLQNKIKNYDINLIEKSKKLGFKNKITREDINRENLEIRTFQERQDNFNNTLKEKWEIINSLQQEINEKNIQKEIFLKDIETIKIQLNNIIHDIENIHDTENKLQNTIQDHYNSIKKLQNELKQIDNNIILSLDKHYTLLKELKLKKEYLDSNFHNYITKFETLKIDEINPEELIKILNEIKEGFKEIKKYYDNIFELMYDDNEDYKNKEKIQSEIENLTNEISLNQIELEKIRKQLKELQNIKEQLQSSYNKYKYDLESIEIEINKLNFKINNEQENMKYIENQIISISETIRNKQNLIETMINLLDEYEDKIKNEKNEINSLYEKLNEKKMQYARIEEKYNSLKNEQNRIEAQIRDIEKIKNNYEKDKNNAIEIINEYTKLIEKDEEEKIKIAENIKNIEVLIKEKSEYLELNLKQKEILTKQIQEIQENINKIEKQINFYDNILSEKKGFLASLKENFKNTYNIEVENIINNYQFDKTNIEELAKEINIIKEQINSLGYVNLLAIEQYQKLQERLYFLREQKIDAEKAINDITNLIKETNQKSEEQFSKSFEEIRKVFKKIFARLFEGGRADLILTNENDILNSGIDILAEPPGKKFQSISLLSGGERALIAIAVIFSILYLKPTPFIVLDEIDAPLDDDNIERFKSLLNDFKQSSQFIIVSHSKSTLEICDVLYGITMEEQGVSKVVNVAFEDANLLIKENNIN